MGCGWGKRKSQKLPVASEREKQKNGRERRKKRKEKKSPEDDNLRAPADGGYYVLECYTQTTSDALMRWQKLGNGAS